MKTRSVVSNLINKEEVFKILALAEAVKLPVLLIGPPGTAKTAAVVDFSKAAGNGTLDDKDLFILETDEGTRSTAIKGNIDLEELTLNQKYKVLSPITEAKIVVINEVDKASGALRNSLLGVMNEKVLFNGKESVECKWNTFVATCNKIPEDEIGSPFWDRFIITFNVERISESDIKDYYDKGAKEFKSSSDIFIPEQKDIEEISLNNANLNKLLSVVYAKLSDRSLTFIPSLIKNIMIVYKCTEVKAMIKSVELLVGKIEANVLSKMLVSNRLRIIHDKIDMIAACINFEQYQEKMDELNLMLAEEASSKPFSKEENEDIVARSVEAESSLSFLGEYEDEDNVFDK